MKDGCLGLQPQTREGFGVTALQQLLGSGTLGAPRNARYIDRLRFSNRESRAWRTKDMRTDALPKSSQCRVLVIFFVIERQVYLDCSRTCWVTNELVDLLHRALCGENARDSKR